MFNFLKDKLKEALSTFSKKVDEEAKPVEEEPPKKPEPVKQPKPASQPVQKPKEPAVAHEKPSVPVKQEPAPSQPKPKPAPIPAEPQKPVPKSEQKVPDHVEQKPTAAREATVSSTQESGPRQTPIKITDQETPSAPVTPKPVQEKPAPVPRALQPASITQEPAPKTVTEDKKPAAADQSPQAEEKHKGSFFDIFKKPFAKKEEPAKPHAEQAPQSQTQVQPQQVKTPEPVQPKIERAEEKPQPEQKQQGGLFQALADRITKKSLTGQQFDELFWELEITLMQNNVAVEVIEKIKQDLKTTLVNTPIERAKIGEVIESSLRKTVEELFAVEGIDIISRIRQKKPYIICFVGINGSGKTTTIAKVAHLLKKNKISSVMAASDTFRAAAIQQLEEHAQKLGIRLIKHDYGADSAAVAFDAVKHAQAHNIDVVLVDTAGRLQSNVNLMDEMKKLKRVIKPDLVLFIGESITGNDCIEQARTFDEQIGIDGIILAKADIDEKGGTAISISYVTRKPILYLGTGQTYDDLVAFDPKIIVESLGLT